jgi:beta-glucosidase
VFCLPLWLTSPTRFGVTYVDYENDQKRYPKKSAKSLKALFDSLIKAD